MGAAKSANAANDKVKQRSFFMAGGQLQQGMKDGASAVLGYSGFWAAMRAYSSCVGVWKSVGVRPAEFIHDSYSARL